MDRLVVMEGGQIKLDGPRDVVLQSLRDRSKKNVTNVQQAAPQEKSADTLAHAANA